MDINGDLLFSKYVMANTIAIIGECMLEVSSNVLNSKVDDEVINTAVNYGGDTINTAVYLARQGIAVSYASALGDDNMSHWLLNQWQAEGVDCRLMTTVKGKLPGSLYDREQPRRRALFLLLAG